jgi:uncharacterized cupredoxin-like copper-binding protein
VLLPNLTPKYVSLLLFVSEMSASRRHSPPIAGQGLHRPDQMQRNMTMISIVRGLAAASFMCVLSAQVFAAAPAQVIHVSLTGEAGQPMGVKLDAPTVAAGDVEFNVSNDAVGTDHEVILVALKSADEVITSNTKKHRVDESKLKTLGEVGGLKAGDKGVLKATLKPGVTYALICNHKSHFELGMATRFTVAK